MTPKDSLDGAPKVFDAATVNSFREGSLSGSAKLLNEEARKKQLRGLQKWGIPLGISNEPPEIVLLARLVWVKYQKRRHEPYLWPAVYYKNYREIANHAPRIWSELGIFKRLPLAASIVFDPSNPSNTNPVVRLLGKADMELTEIPRKSHSEFHRDLPEMLQKAGCNIDYFAQDPGLYFDWHRALDEVELILRECLGTRYTLTTESPFKSWHDRAKDAERARWRSAMSPETLLSRCACSRYNCGSFDVEEEGEDNAEILESISGVRVY